MARGKLHAPLRQGCGGRDQVGERIARRGAAHRLHHRIIGVRAGDGREIGKARPQQRLLRSHAPGDDDRPAGGLSLGDRLQALLASAVEEGARVDHNGVGLIIGRGGVVSLPFQPGQDAF